MRAKRSAALWRPQPEGLAQAGIHDTIYIAQHAFFHSAGRHNEDRNVGRLCPATRSGHLPTERDEAGHRQRDVAPEGRQPKILGHIADKDLKHQDQISWRIALRSPGRIASYDVGEF